MARLPTTGPSLLRHLRETERQALRQAQTSAFSVPLTPGTITNDELAAPVDPAAVNITATNFAVSTVWAEVVGVDLIVPPGCTRLLLNATAWVYAVNNTAGVDNLSARVSLGLVDGQAFLTPLPVGGFNTVSSGLATLAGSLVEGSVLRLLASAKSTTGAFTADPANTALLTASLRWMR